MPKKIEHPEFGVVEFPDNMSDDEIVRVFKENSATKQPTPDKPFQSARDIGAGLVRGAGSIGATLVAPYDIAKDAIQGRGLSMLSNRERRDAMDSALTGLVGSNPENMLYKGGKMAAEIAGTLPVGGLLGAGAKAAGATNLAQSLTTGGMRAGTGGMLTRMAGGAGSGAASAALVNPEDAAAGGVMGAALPGAAKSLGMAAKALRPAIDPLAQKAINAGLPVSLADVSLNPVVKGMQSVLGDIPVIRGSAIANANAKQQWLNNSVGKSFGEQANSLTPEIMDSAKKRLGGEFNRIWGQNAVKLDGQFIDDISKIQNDALTKLNPDQAAQVERQIQNLLGKLDGDSIPGNFANNWQSELRMAADSEKGLHQKVLRDLRKTTLSAFDRSIPVDDVAKLAKNKDQYRAFKTVEPLMQKGELGVAGRDIGDVPAALLPNAVFQQYGTGASRTPLGEAAQLGSKFVADRVSRTGGSPRALVQNSFLAGLLGAGSLLSPSALLSVPGAYGAGKALNSNQMAKMLVKQRGMGLLGNVSDDALMLTPAMVGASAGLLNY